MSPLEKHLFMRVEWLNSITNSNIFSIDKFDKNTVKGDF